jgi:hypothetical protein
MYDLQNTLTGSQQTPRRPVRTIRRSAYAYGGEPEWPSSSVSSRASPLDLGTARQPSSSVGVPFASMILAHLERDQLQAARKLLSIAQDQETGNPALALLARLLAPPGVRAAPTAGESKVAFPALSILESFRGEWVAIAAGQIVGHARVLKTLVEELKTQSHSTRPILHLVPR